MRMLRTDYTGIFEDVVMPTKGEERASFEDDGEDDKDNDRTTEQRCKNRQDTPRTAKIRQEPPRYAEPDTPRYAEPDTPRYAEPAARVRYKYETCFGNNGRAGMIQYSIWIYLFPTLCCVLLLLVTYLPGPVPVPLFVVLYNLLIVIVLSVVQHTTICA